MVKVSKRFLDYFSSKHKSLGRNYSTEFGEGRDSCLLIAIELAQKLREEKIEPTILKVMADKDQDDWLIPRGYNPKIRWYVHIICSANGLIYDPLLKNPISINKYSQRVFGRTLSFQEVNLTA